MPARLLLTAGPTWEPIDAVRYLGNRSSGKLGVAVADAASDSGWDVTMLLGPGAARPTDKAVRVIDFESAADLEELLSAHLPQCDVLVMAAAVADYRPVAHEVSLNSKRRRKGPTTLELEPTPDLLRGCAEHRRADQLLVGFALEPADGLLEAARGKLERKRVDAVVANPLETMGSDSIEATLVLRDGLGDGRSTPGPISKASFATWLVSAIEELHQHVQGTRVSPEQTSEANQQ